MELLSEGGLLAFVTSRGVADTAGNKFVREYLVNHADLISAVRLPDALFHADKRYRGRQRPAHIPETYQ